MKLFAHPAGKEIGSVLFLLFLVCIFFAHVFFSREPVILSCAESEDLIAQFFPWRHFGFQSIRRGVFPLWNPYLFGGFPFLTEIQTSIFYPPNLIFLFLPTHTALNLSEILHIYLTGVFTYWFLRSLKLRRLSSLIGATAFMFSAPVIFHIHPGHVSNICTMAWIPLVFLLLEKFLNTRKAIFAVLMGAVFSLQLLAGHPQYLFYTFIAALFYLLFRIISDKECRKNWLFLGCGFAAAVVISAALSAVQLLVALEGIHHSVRMNLRYEYIATFSFVPENLITLLVPSFFGDHASFYYWGRDCIWEMCAYVGIIPLILVAAAAVRRRNKYNFPFLAVAVIVLILALGGFTPLLKILYLYVPGFDLFRGSSKFICQFAFCLAVLSALGADFFTGACDRKETRDFARVALGAASAAVLIFLVFVIMRLNGGGESLLWKRIVGWSISLRNSSISWKIPIAPSFLRGAFFFAFKAVIIAVVFFAAAAVLFLLARKKKIKPLFLSIALLVLVVADLLVFGMPFVTTTPVSACFWDEDLVTFLKRDADVFRVGLPDSRIPGVNLGMNHGIATVGGSGTNINLSYTVLFNLSQKYPPGRLSKSAKVQRLSPLTDLLNLKYFIVPAQQEISDEHLELVFRGERVTVYKNRRCLPRAFLVHRAKVAQKNEDVFADLTRSDFIPDEYIIIGDKPPFPLDHEKVAGEEPPRITEYGINRVTIHAEPLSDGFLVLSDTYYPDWKVYVDGRKEKIYRADVALRAVFLKKGRHSVEFVYAPSFLKIGMIISVLALAGVLVFTGSAVIGGKKWWLGTRRGNRTEN